MSPDPQPAKSVFTPLVKVIAVLIVVAFGLLIAAAWATGTYWPQRLAGTAALLACAALCVGAAEAWRRDQ